MVLKFDELYERISYFKSILREPGFHLSLLQSKKIDSADIPLEEVDVMNLWHWIILVIMEHDIIWIFLYSIMMILNLILIIHMLTR